MYYTRNTVMSLVAGYKVMIQKSITFLYTANEQVEFETKNTMPFILTSFQWNT